MEVLDAQFEKAKMCARIGDKTAAYEAYDTIAEKAKISTGKKIDAVMARTRVALFHLDTPQVSVCFFFFCVFLCSYFFCFVSSSLGFCLIGWLFCFCSVVFFLLLVLAWS